MTFQERRDRALTLMDDSGLPSMVVEPPLHRLLWKFGAEVPPPHFGGLWPVRLQMAMAGVVFAHGVSDMLGVPWPVAAIGLALLFGMSIGSQYDSQADALGLPSWDEVDHADVRVGPRSILGLDRPPSDR